MMKLTTSLRGVKRYWMIVAVVLSLFSVDWFYIGVLRSILAYALISRITKSMNLVLVIAGFAWSQAIKTAMGPRPSYVLKIVAPLAYKLKGDQKIGFKVLSTHDLRNTRIDVQDVYEELLVLQRGKEPDAILIRKVTPPPQPARYRPRTPEDWG